MSDPVRSTEHPDQSTQTPEARERAPALPGDHPALRDQSGDEIRTGQRTRDREAMTSWGVPRSTS